MTIRTADDLYYDPWDVDLNADPYPMFRRIRENAPLYYNTEHDFYALSRFDDVNRALVGLGNALARVEGRIALDEIMTRFPDWEVDLDAAVFSSSSAVRGWDSMPAHV